MKKKLVTFITVGFVLAVLLLIQYTIQKEYKHAGTGAIESAETIESTPTISVAAARSDVKKIKIVNTTGTVELLPANVTASGNVTSDWVLETKPEFPVNQNAVNQMAESAIGTKLRWLGEQATDMGPFGLDAAKAEVVVTLANGENRTVKIGKPTPDQTNYYAAFNNEKGIYLMNSGDAKQLLLSTNELFDRKIPEINVRSLKSVEVFKSGKLILDVQAKTNKQSVVASLPGAHLVPASDLVMKYPVPNRDVYLEDFARSVFGLRDGAFNVTGATIQIGSVVEEKPLDLGRYGLTPPAVELKIQDDQNKYDLLLGETSGDEVYAKFADKTYIFSISKASIQSLMTFEPTKFIDRFLALTHIVDCDEIVIDTASSKFDVKINHVPLASGQGAEEQNGTVNGKVIGVDPLRRLYQMIIGLSFDAFIEPVDKPGDLVITIRYTTKQGGKTVTFYSYNDNFYLVQVGDEPAHYLINEQAIAEVLTACNDIMADRY
ncbi:DUF4340 domain-containing protein [Paenibacillus ginsengarvi]|nr:DUF4340 domain-containing protein [Paenibacillus ginsengarvi]